MESMIVTKQEIEILTSIFSTENYLKRSADYLKDGWLIKENYSVLPIEWFKIGDFEQYKEEHQYFKRLLKNEKELNLAGFPLHSGLPSYDKSLEKILNNHNAPKPTEESKDIFQGVKDFYDYLKNEEDIYFFNEILYASNLELFIIISIDMEVIFICYADNLKKKIENIYANYSWKYSYETYLEHIQDFKNRELL